MLYMIEDSDFGEDYVEAEDIADAIEFWQSYYVVEAEPTSITRVSDKAVLRFEDLNDVETD